MSDTSKPISEKEKARRERFRQLGTLGGQKTAQTYGKGYMSELGKIGFRAYADRYHDGNRAKARAALAIATNPNTRVRQPGPFR